MGSPSADTAPIFRRLQRDDDEAFEEVVNYPGLRTTGRASPGRQSTLTLRPEETPSWLHQWLERASARGLKRSLCTDANRDPENAWLVVWHAGSKTEELANQSETMSRRFRPGLTMAIELPDRVSVQLRGLPHLFCAPTTDWLKSEWKKKEPALHAQARRLEARMADFGDPSLGRALLRIDLLEDIPGPMIQISYSAQRELWIVGTESYARFFKLDGERICQEVEDFLLNPAVDKCTAHEVNVFHAAAAVFRVIRFAPEDALKRLRQILELCTLCGKLCSREFLRENTKKSSPRSLRKAEHEAGISLPPLIENVVFHALVLKDPTHSTNLGLPLLAHSPITELLSHLHLRVAQTISPKAVLKNARDPLTFAATEHVKALSNLSSLTKATLTSNQPYGHLLFIRAFATDRGDIQRSIEMKTRSSPRKIGHTEVATKERFAHEVRNLVIHPTFYGARLPTMLSAMTALIHASLISLIDASPTDLRLAERSATLEARIRSEGYRLASILPFEKLRTQALVVGPLPFATKARKIYQAVEARCASVEGFEQLRRLLSKDVASAAEALWQESSAPSLEDCVVLEAEVEDSSPVTSDLFGSDVEENTPISLPRLSVPEQNPFAMAQSPLKKATAQDTVPAAQLVYGLRDNVEVIQAVSDGHESLTPSEPEVLDMDDDSSIEHLDQTPPATQVGQDMSLPSSNIWNIDNQIQKSTQTQVPSEQEQPLQVSPPHPHPPRQTSAPPSPTPPSILSISEDTPPSSFPIEEKIPQQKTPQESPQNIDEQQQEQDSLSTENLAEPFFTLIEEDSEPLLASEVRPPQLCVNETDPLEADLIVTSENDLIVTSPVELTADLTVDLTALDSSRSVEAEETTQPVSVDDQSNILTQPVVECLPEAETVEAEAVSEVPAESEASKPATMNNLEELTAVPVGEAAAGVETVGESVTLLESSEQPEEAAESLVTLDKDEEVTARVTEATEEIGTEQGQMVEVLTQSEIAWTSQTLEAEVETRTGMILAEGLDELLVADTPMTEVITSRSEAAVPSVEEIADENEGTEAETQTLEDETHIVETEVRAEDIRVEPTASDEAPSSLGSFVDEEPPMTSMEEGLSNETETQKDDTEENPQPLEQVGMRDEPVADLRAEGITEQETALVAVPEGTESANLDEFVEVASAERPQVAAESPRLLEAHAPMTPLAAPSSCPEDYGPDDGGLPIADYSTSSPEGWETTQRPTTPAIGSPQETPVEVVDSTPEGLAELSGSDGPLVLISSSSAPSPAEIEPSREQEMRGAADLHQETAGGVSMREEVSTPMARDIGKTAVADDESGDSDTPFLSQRRKRLAQTKAGEPSVKKIKNERRPWRSQLVYQTHIPSTSSGTRLLLDSAIQITPAGGLQGSWRRKRRRQIVDSDMDEASCVSRRAEQSRHRPLFDSAAESRMTLVPSGGRMHNSPVLRTGMRSADHLLNSASNIFLVSAARNRQQLCITSDGLPLDWGRRSAPPLIVLDSDSDS